MADAEGTSRQAAWDAMAVAWLQGLAVAASFGLGAIELDALAAELVAAMRLAAH